MNLGGMVVEAVFVGGLDGKIEKTRDMHSPASRSRAPRYKS
jgi:hypothetical protein